MDLNLSRRVALVTGGGRGNGRAFALALAREGASVAVVDLEEEMAARVAQEIQNAGGSAVAIRADVSRWDDISGAIQKTAQQYGSLDILVNNAGLRIMSSLEETTDELWDLHINVCLKGVFYGCKAAAPIMKAQRWGRIISISSTSGRRGHPFGGSAYAAAKAGVLGLTKSVARELAPYGVTANAIAPGTVRTRFVDDFTPEQLENLRQRMPLGRIAEPEDLVGTLLLLASDAGGYITGQCITVDGGQLMM